MRVFVLLSLGLNALAATVSLKWDVGYVSADPDKSGHSRRVIGINGKWPPPQINVNLGDQVRVELTNKLNDWNTTLHWHGIRQKGSGNYDGPEYVTQCPIPPNDVMVYNFPINQPGTYWYHSHVAGQYPDGFRGAIVVHDPQSPYKNQYDEEIVLTLSDWYYDEMRKLIPRFLNPHNDQGIEPFPNATLINDTKEPKINVKPNKTYLVRIVNIGAFLTYRLWFQDHPFEIVELDGIYTQQGKAEQINVAPAQRYSILLKTKSSTQKNYPFVAFVDNLDSFSLVPPKFNPTATGWLVYDAKAALPQATATSPKPIDDVGLVPFDKAPRLKNADHTITLGVSFHNKAGKNDKINYAFFNDITYEAPQIPTLFTALNANATAIFKPETYGKFTNPYVIKNNEIVDIVINNFDPGPHPFHLHGHEVQVLYRSAPNAAPFKGSGGIQYPAIPMRRDTVSINANGVLVLRYKADNPGVWLFHCHIEWHILQGLTSTLIESPDRLKGLIQIPEDQYKICADTGIDVSPPATYSRGDATNNGFAAPDTPPSLDLLPVLDQLVL